MVSKSSASLQCPTFDFQPDSKTFHASNACFLAQVCSLTYEEDSDIKPQVNQVWKFPNYHFFNSEGTDTQGFMMGNDQVIVLAFRGTHGSKDWRMNLQVNQISQCHGMVHEGFWKALDSVWNEIFATIRQFRDKKQPIFVTGHSLGGALATLAVARLLDELVEEHEPKDQVKENLCLYTFGSPRVGNPEFTKWFDFDRKFRDSTFRVVYSFDIVTQIALKKGHGRYEYDHVGLIHYFDRNNRLIDKIFAWKCFKLGFRLRLKAEMTMKQLNLKAEDPSTRTASVSDLQPEDPDFQISLKEIIRHLLTDIKDHHINSYMDCLEKHRQATLLAKTSISPIAKVAAKIQQIPQTLQAITPRST